MTTTSSTDNVQASLKQRLREELQPGEALVWAGRPLPGRMGLEAVPATVFFLLWGSFGPLWFRAGGDAGFGLVALLIGLVWCTVAVIGITAPWWTYRKAGRTLYALTNERALVLVGGRRTVECTSYALDRVTALHCVERRHGIGDVVLMREAWKDSDGDPQQRQHGFMAIPYARRVYRLVQRQQQACGGQLAQAPCTGQPA